MPVSVVVGGQFGSEGKGKVALETAKRLHAAAVVRVGGTNSGHTGIAEDGRPVALRQLPAAALARGVLVVLPPGSLIDLPIFEQEIDLLGLTHDTVKVDYRATVITEGDKAAERRTGLVESIGSTGSGTDAALQRRISREGDGRGVLASDFDSLRGFLTDTTPLLRVLLESGERIVIEGTQGFGLSILHGDHYPRATSRDTTAGTFVSEAGLSPLDVDEIILVIRTFPIRVAGNSGELYGEMTWEEVAERAGLPSGYHELTTATRRVRRVGQFAPGLVQRAIAANNPTQIVLNHLDYVDASASKGNFSSRAGKFVQWVEDHIGRTISWVGTGPGSLVSRKHVDAQEAA